MKESILCDQFKSWAIECYSSPYPSATSQPASSNGGGVPSGLCFRAAGPGADGILHDAVDPGEAGIFSFFRIPSHVPDNLINATRPYVDEIHAAGVENLLGLKSGETVVIRDGPFEGYEVIMATRIPDSERVRVLLKLLQGRQQDSELPDSQIEHVREEQC